MQTAELETTYIVAEWQYNYRVRKGDSFYIIQDDFNLINKRGFYLLDEKLITEDSVASWKVTPKKVNQ